MHANEARVRALLDRIHAGDVSGIDPADHFTPDATYEPLVPVVPAINGRDAIVAEIARQLAVYSDLHAEIHVVVADDRHVFTERTDHASFPNGKRVSVPLMAIFELTPDGLISAWREIFDSRSAEQQIGVDPVEMAKIMGQ
jgi:limonene-1,2-epoxide hydrolase